LKKLILKYRHVFTLAVSLIASCIFLLLIGCSSPRIDLNCESKAEAIYISAILEGYKARIVRGPTGNGRWHRQAQIFVNGKWEWAETDGSHIYPGKKDWWFDPQEIVKE